MPTTTNPQTAIDAIATLVYAVAKSQRLVLEGSGAGALREKKKAIARVFTLIVGREPTEEELGRLRADQVVEG